MSDTPEARTQAAVQLRIIGLALMLGPALFLGVSYFLRRGGMGESESLAWHSYLDWIALFLALNAAGAQVWVPALIGARAPDRIEAFQRCSIVRLAMSEGTALFGTVAYFITGRPMGAGVAIAMIVFMAVVQFPTRERLDAWIDRAA